MSDKEKIRILPDFVANQIAAGEVVQRPESVVKELTENSLDAGATEIAVLVKDAGKTLIHIVDNGKGMGEDDLRLSIKRHATSKIVSAEDLERIKTLGFRGEALAAIASVANVEIITRIKDEKIGYRLKSEPMKDATVEPCNAEVGTQVFVRNLFYNVPARRKFLKSKLTEFRHISDTMLKLALSNPNIRFAFYDDDALIFDAKPSDLKGRIEQTLSKSVASSLISIENEREGVKISGYVGEPLIAKKSKSGQFLFLNGRSVFSKSLSYAVFSAYEHLLEKRSHPFFLINIKIDPEEYDVNVHPQKQEVKFENERLLFNLINKTVNEALAKRDLTAESDLDFGSETPPIEKEKTGSGDMILVNKSTGEVVSSSVNRGRSEFSGGGQFRGDKSSSMKFDWEKERESSRKPTESEMSAYEALFKEKERRNEERGDEEDSIEATRINHYWQLHDKYVFAQTDKGLMIIDQHAAHERILYERAVKAMNKKFDYAQELLFPVSAKIDSSQIAVLKEIKEYLESLGFVFDILDEGNVNIKAVPLDITQKEERKSLVEIVELYEEYQKTRESDDRDNLAASFSCKAAIKTGQKLSQEEIEGLMTELFKCSVPYVCPHGRPTIIEFELKDFDKRFGRI